MTRLRIIFPIFIFLSCGQVNESPLIQENLVGQPYFNFDEIIHYHIDITEDEVIALNTKTNKSIQDSLLDNILIQYVNENVKDSSFLNSLEILPFKKTIIDKSLFDKFNEIFTEKKHPDPVYASCIATWRDILIFKKSQTTVGVAKICFDCNRNSIAGTKSNTSEFGQSGDYEKLYGLLKIK